LKVGAFEILLFFVCLNLSFYIIDYMDFLPYSIQATETPTSINAQITGRIGSSIAIMIGGVLCGLLVSALIQGAAIALVLAALNLLFPIFEWIFLGFPKFLTKIGVPEPIYLALSVLIGLVWVWFLVGIVAQRYME